MYLLEYVIVYLKFSQHSDSVFQQLFHLKRSNFNCVSLRKTLVMTVILTPLDVVVIFVHVLIPIVQYVFTFVPCRNFFVRIFLTG